MPNLNTEKDLHDYFYECDYEVDYQEIDFIYPPSIDNIELFKGENLSIVYFKITDKNGETLSLLRLAPFEIKNISLYQVSIISSKKRKKGLAYSLYRNALHHIDKPIISGSMNTIPGSYNIWRKLINDSKSEDISIQIVDLNKELLKDYDYKTPRIYIWGYDDEILLEMEDTPGIIEEMYDIRDITKELYQYLKDFHKKLSGKKHVRLILKLAK